MSRRQPRRDVFRTTATLRWLIVGVTMLFAALLGIAFVTGPPTLFYGFVALTVFGVLGIVETIVTRVELHDDHIVAVAFFTRRTYRRDEITAERRRITTQCVTRSVGPEAFAPSGAQASA